MDLTKELAIKLHREMWHYIADEIKKNKQFMNTLDLKRRFVKEHKEYEKMLSMYDCFLCEYVFIDYQNEHVEDKKYGKVTGKNHCCCILDWRIGTENNGNSCALPKTLFMKCLNAKNWEEQYQAALDISELPEIEEE